LALPPGAKSENNITHQLKVADTSTCSMAYYLGFSFDFLFNVTEVKVLLGQLAGHVVVHVPLDQVTRQNKFQTGLILGHQWAKTEITILD
jgi:hypothetical protein